MGLRSSNFRSQICLGHCRANNSNFEQSSLRQIFPYVLLWFPALKVFDRAMRS